MKPILINIDEISDSREVYESRPNIFFSVFIYTILALFIVALIWMYLGRIDVVVKSEGMLRPNNQVATVVNTYGGTLDQVNIEDGASVKEGDILYIINHDDLLTEQTYLEEQLKDVKSKLELLSKYKSSIEDGRNHFANIEAEEEYYLKYQGFEINYELMSNDIMYSDKERALSLSSVKEQLDTYNTKLANSKKLKQAITSNKNAFSKTGSEKEYHNLFLKYQSDYHSLETQYANKKIEIDHSTTEEGLVNSLEYYGKVLSGLNNVKTSIIKEKSVFENTDSYYLQYEEYVNKLADLTDSSQKAKDTYEINKELAGLAVTEWEVQQSKVAMDEAERAINTFEVSYLANLNSSITDTEKNIRELMLSKENTITKDKLYERNDEDKSAALENYQLKYIIELNNTITSLSENIMSLEAKKSSLELQEERTVLYEEENTDAKLSEYKNKELSTTISSLNAYMDRQKELLASMDKIKSQMNDAVVKATKSGVINSHVELVEGDVLSSGTEVLTIIPGDNSEFKVNIYVSNEDIGKLREGMKVKLNIYALPNTEYGYLTGSITDISKDLKVDASSGSGYYLAEASLKNKALYDSQGNKAQLKAGMACQAQMITESKRILTYVLEKIDLLIH